MFRQTLRSIAVLCLPALVACRGGSNPAAPSDAPVHARGTPRTVVPTGKGIGTRNYSIGPRTRYKVEYHNGVVSLGSVRIYFIFYGGFQDQDPVAQVLTDFAASVNGTGYAMMNSVYPDLSGAAHTGSILWGRNTVDPYSRGASLSESDLPVVVQNSIANGALPLDSNGLYVVVGSSDITLPGLGQTFCALHGRTSYAGTGVSYAFLGHPAISPGSCALQLSGPSGNWAADAQVYLLGVEFSNFIVNPWVTNGWFDRIGLEPADKCAWDMGPTYQAPNGALANLELGGRHYLVPRLWVQQKHAGYCALSLP